MSTAPSLPAKILGAIKDRVFLQVFIAIFFSVTCYQFLPVEVISFAYALSASMRQILVFVLPFLIIGSIISAFADIPREKFWFILVLLLTICFVNFINLMVSYFFASTFISQDHGAVKVALHTAEGIAPYFNFKLEPLLKNDYALIIGAVLGVSASFFSIEPIKHAGRSLYKVCFQFMMKCFIPLLPIFIGGFFLKMMKEGLLTSFVSEHLSTSLLMIGFLALYLFVWFLIASGFRLLKLKEIFFNVAPAMVTAFSTMSSAAALPLTIKAAEENTQDPALARSVVPISMNLHMCGDTICIPIMIFIVMQNFGMPLPTFNEFAVFGLYFVLNKFAGGGVPGGTIIVTAPVMQRILGFTPEMAALTVAVYAIFDPIATTGNVTANNLLIIFFKKIMNCFSKKPISETETDTGPETETPEDEIPAKRGASYHD